MHLLPDLSVRAVSLFPLLSSVAVSQISRGGSKAFFKCENVTVNLQKLATGMQGQ